MNDSNPIYYDPNYKDNTKRHIAIALGVLLMLIVIGVYYFVEKDRIVDINTVDTNVLEEEQKLTDALKASISGYLLLDTYKLQKDGSLATSTVIQVSLGDDVEFQVLSQNQGINYLISNSLKTGTFIKYDREDNLYKAISYNLDTQQFTFLEPPLGFYINKIFPPQKTSTWYIGDSIEKDAYGTEDQNNLQHWRVAVVNINAEEIFVEAESVSPQWIEEGVDLALIKSDGVYQYNIQSKIFNKIFNGYTSFSGSTELAVSPEEGEYMVVTVPSVATMSILRRNTKDTIAYIETARIQTENKNYHSPVFDPTGKFFAVVQKDLNNKKSTVVIYSSITGEFLREVSIRKLDADIFVLSAWGDIPITIDSN